MALSVYHPWRGRVASGLLCVTLVVLTWAVVVAEQDGERATPLPVLTDVQRLKIQNLSLRLELAQLKAQAAQRDFDAARVEITALVASFQVEGYTLDLATLTYRPVLTKEELR